VRELISAGAVSKAYRLLGRWPELEGNIVSGAGRGRSVTVPTLNLEAENELLPGRGVYITRISLDGGRFLHAVTNIGRRPTFDGSTLTVETFVLTDPAPDLDKFARLRFIKRLRDEMKFESPDSLRRQIGIDIIRARQFYSRLAPLSHVRSNSR